MTSRKKETAIERRERLAGKKRDLAAEKRRVGDKEYQRTRASDAERAKDIVAKGREARQSLGVNRNAVFGVVAQGERSINPQVPAPPVRGRKRTTLPPMNPEVLR